MFTIFGKFFWSKTFCIILIHYHLKNIVFGVLFVFIKLTKFHLLKIKINTYFGKWCELKFMLVLLFTAQIWNYKSSSRCSSIAIVRDVCFRPSLPRPSIAARTADSSFLNYLIKHVHILKNDHTSDFVWPEKTRKARKLRKDERKFTKQK